MRYHTPNPFRSPRSVLSSQAAWPATEATEAPPAPRYTDEQTLALRAWASYGFRQLPLAEQLRTLLHYPGLNARPVYARQARQALATNCPIQQGKALEGLREETDRLRENRRQLRQQAPLLFPVIAA